MKKLKILSLNIQLFFCTFDHLTGVITDEEYLILSNILKQEIWKLKSQN